MLAAHLLALANERPDASALICPAGKLSYRLLAERIRERTACWAGLAGQRIGVIGGEPLTWLPTVAALDAVGAHAFLAGRRPAPELESLAARFAWVAVIDDSGEARALAAPEAPPIAEPGTAIVTLLTSGTTGPAKAANHTWATLAAPVRRDPRYADTRWLCAYALNMYAGTQVLLQAALNGAVLVIASSPEPDVVAATLAREGVTHASGTPTFWRRLLLFGPRSELTACRLQQITLGGEAVPQDLLDQLAAVFPHTRLVHIYASTELGRLFTVVDRREGFPAEYLVRNPEAGIELSVRDGELHARSHNAMRGYDGEPSLPTGDWQATGDLVEQRDDRILFRGRRTDVINVGGRKVLPASVEAVLRSVPGVVDVRVYGKRSSLVGQLVAADIVLAADHAEADVRRDIARLARAQLAEHEVPRLLRTVPFIAHNDALKISRREES
jgi:acyl-CoA synthetase (AMP-forming)/AMP-acid ligase II